MKKYSVILLLIVFALGCSSNEDLEMENIEYSLISKGNLYGDGAEGISKQNLVIGDQDSWTSLRNKMNTHNNVSDSFSEIAIDFTKFIIIAVFDEIKSNGGYEYELNIETDAERIFVIVTELNPTGNATTVITQPYSIIKIATTDLAITFQ